MPSINIERFAKPLPNSGDTRRVYERVKKGSVIYLKGKGIYELTTTVEMEVTRIYKYGRWEFEDYHPETARTVTSNWQRFKLWLMGPKLPKAKALR